MRALMAAMSGVPLPPPGGRPVDPEDDAPAPHEGTAVRLAGPVDPNPLGIVQKNVAGRVTVKFPTTESTHAPSELVVDESQQRIQPGVVVRVKRSVGSPENGWGGVSHASIGMVVERAKLGHEVKTNFNNDEHPCWTGNLDELELVPPDANPTIAGTDGLRIGSCVRVKPGIATPRGGWGGHMNRLAVGRVAGWRTGVNNETVKVIWPGLGQHEWNAAYSELELVAEAEVVTIGSRVKIHPEMSSVRLGMPEVISPGEVGTVRQVGPDGCVFVRFPTARRWFAFDLHELVTASTRLREPQPCASA